MMENFKPKRIVEGIRKAAMGTATAISTLGGGVGAFAGESAENVIAHPDAHSISAKVDNKSDISTEKTYDASGDFGKNTENLANSIEDEKDDPEKKAGASESMKLDLAAYFETGSAELKPADIERIQTDLTTYLQSLPADIQDKIHTGEMIFVIESGCSPEPITKAIEVIEGSGKYARNNGELADFRNKSTLPFVRNTINQQGFEYARIEVSTPKDGISEDGQKKVTVRVEMKETFYEKDIKKRLESVAIVILDRSASMKRVGNAAEQAIANVNQDREIPIEVVTLAGGSDESYLMSLEGILPMLKAIPRQEGVTEIVILTNEKDDGTIPNMDISTPEGLAGAQEYAQRIQDVFECEVNGQKFRFIAWYLSNSPMEVVDLSENPEFFMDTSPQRVRGDQGPVSF